MNREQKTNKVTKTLVLRSSKGVQQPDGSTPDILEGIEFNALCGCRIVFGIRGDTAARTMKHESCFLHEMVTELLRQQFVDAGATPTELRIWRLLK